MMYDRDQIQVMSRPIGAYGHNLTYQINTLIHTY